MVAVKITSKGQTTIPKNIRKVLGVEPGDKVDFVIGEEGRVYLHPSLSKLSNLKGILKTKVKRKVSLEDMEKAIQDGATRGQV